MTSLEAFLKCFSVYAEAKNLRESSLSTYIFGNGQKIAILRSGGDLGTKQFEKAMRWLSKHWPDDTPWPSDITRPAPLAEVA